jgi:hypothetical protein
MISNTPYYKLNIPEMSGGINLRDGISLIKDNQLTDCKNVWYKDGMLRTRPGLQCAVGSYEIEDPDSYSTGNYKKLYVKRENFRVIDGKTYFLEVSQSAEKLSFKYVADDRSAISVANIYASELPPKECTCNIFQHDADIYCFCSGYYENETTPYYIFKIREIGDKRWETARVGVDKDSQPYIPTILINGTAVSGETARSHSQEGAAQSFNNATMLEGLNLLGNNMRILYNAVNRELLEVNPFLVEGDKLYNVPYHTMCYALPHITKFVGSGSVDATITYSDGRVADHSVSVNVDKDTHDFENEELVPNTVDGFRMRISFDTNNAYAFMEFLDDNADITDGLAYVTVADVDMLNNIEVFSPCVNSKENYEKVMNNTFNEWYGGGSEGLYGGIHLFMGGNIKNEKALVCWSDFNKPLYFSENNYAYVGDKSQTVTAFGKQGEALVIFKEREMYATQYRSLNTSMDADDVINQSVVDVVANEVAFPMVQVHGFIGCDCPESVQLCRNRLVWAHSDGKIYTLVSANQYNERVVYEVSDMVEKRLKEHSTSEIRKAKSADWEGHYILNIGDKLYLMDYNSYGFSNVYSYSKSDDAQANIPWWVWELPNRKVNIYHHATNANDRYVERTFEPFKLLALIVFNTKLCVYGEFKAISDGINSFYIQEMLIFEGMKDRVTNITSWWSASMSGLSRESSESDIPTMFQTKFFDFGSPTVKKSVPKIEVAFGTNGGVPIKTKIITESSVDEQEFVIDEQEEREYATSYFQNRLIRPGNKHAYRMGLCFESDGEMSLDSISLQYKHLRGLK